MKRKTKIIIGSVAGVLCVLAVVVAFLSVGRAGGEIGFEALNKIVHAPEFLAVPKILETPYVPKVPGEKEKSLAPYREEIAMLRAGVFAPDLYERIRNNG